MELLSWLLDRISRGQKSGGDYGKNSYNERYGSTFTDNVPSATSSNFFDNLGNGINDLWNSNFINSIKDIWSFIQNPALEQSDRQFNQELNWQKQQYASQLDFANRQLSDNINVANNNLALQQNAFNYQQQLNQTQMQREDSAMQRRVADLLQAGFSPLAAVGSNGASSSPLSSANAPQMDMTGINQASGNYIDIAKQYSQLHMMAYNDNQNRKLQARLQAQSLKQGAKIALAEMRNQLDISNNNLAMQGLQLAQRQYEFDSDFELRRAESDWMQKHGYRNQDIQAYLVGMVASFIDKHNPTQLIDKFNEFKDGLSQSVKDKLDSFKKDIQDIKDGKVYSSEVKKVLDSDVPKEAKEIVSKEYTGKKYDDLSKYEQEEVDNLTKLSLSIPF